MSSAWTSPQAGDRVGRSRPGPHLIAMDVVRICMSSSAPGRPAACSTQRYASSSESSSSRRPRATSAHAAGALLAGASAAAAIVFAHALVAAEFGRGNFCNPRPPERYFAGGVVRVLPLLIDAQARPRIPPGRHGVPARAFAKEPVRARSAPSPAPPANRAGIDPPEGTAIATASSEARGAGRYGRWPRPGTARTPCGRSRTC